MGVEDISIDTKADTSLSPVREFKHSVIDMCFDLCGGRVSPVMLFERFPNLFDDVV